jgi:hypothetical protein
MLINEELHEENGIPKNNSNIRSLLGQGKVGTADYADVDPHPSQTSEFFNDEPGGFENLSGKNLLLIT